MTPWSPVVIQSPMNFSRVASGLPQYSRNITGSGRLTAIWPSSPGLRTRAVAADHRDRVAGHRLADRAGPRHADRRAGADHQVAFGLAVELVDGERRAPPCPIRRSRRRAPRRRSRPSAARMSWRPRGFGTARSMRSAVGGMKALRTPMRAISAKASSGSNLSKRARHHRHAVMQARQQAHRAGRRPRPSRPASRSGRPAAGRTRAAARCPADGRAARDGACSAPLGWPGGAGGVDHHRRIVGRGGDRREIGRGARERLGKAERAVARSVDRQDELEVRQLALRDLGDLGEPLRVGDQRLGAGILQAIGERVGAEQDRERQRDRAELVDRDVDGRDLRRLRQQDRDAVAARDAVRGQRVGEPVRGLAQPAVADVLARGRPARTCDEREPARLALRPAVADVDADIVTAPGSASGIGG